MDGIEKIIGRINAAAAEECAAIAQKAQQDCDVIRAEYAQKVQSAYESAVKSGEAEISLDAEHLIRNAKLDAREEILSVKQEVLNMAFDAAKVKLSTLSEDKYLAWLVSMACEVSNGSGELILSKRDAALGERIAAKANEVLISQGKKGELTVSQDVCDIDAGFILREGNTEVDCSLSAILEFKRKNMAAAVADMLFG